MDIHRKERIRELAKRNRQYLGKGVRTRRFRKPNKWIIRNRVLMAILLVDNIKLSHLAEKVGVSARTVGAWVYEARQPSEENQRKVSEVIGLPEHILFAENQGDPEIHPLEESKFMWRVFNSPVKNKILAGLFALHDISPTDVSHWIGMNPGTMRKYMHAGALPIDEYQKKIEDFFQMPRSLIFAECFLN